MSEQLFYLETLLGALLFAIGFSMNSELWKSKVAILPLKILWANEKAGFELSEEKKREVETIVGKAIKEELKRDTFDKKQFLASIMLMALGLLILLYELP
ncbi:MAG: hypothetical protein QFX40_08575 [Archaeoglobales archaeon]|nr:hypothetical protein [Archaeoglobales archaeon]